MWSAFVVGDGHECSFRHALASGPQDVGARDLERIDVALRLLDADPDRLGVEDAPYGPEVAAGTRGGGVGASPGFIGLRAGLLEFVAGPAEPLPRVRRCGLGEGG